MKERTRTAIILILVGLLLNLSLAFTKFFVGLRVNSVCILLDGTNNFLDTFTAFVTAIAFALTAKKATDKYPYGFGRSEYLAAFVVSLSTFVVGIMFLRDSLERISMPEPVWGSVRYIVLLSVSVLVKLAMAVCYGLFNKKLRSDALKSIITDSYLDVGITTATVVSYTLSAKVSYAMDAIFGIVISVAALGISVKLIIDNIRLITGSSSCSEEKEEILSLCRREPSVTAVNDIKLHDYGYKAKVGTVYISYTGNVSQTDILEINERLKKSLYEKTGAKVDFISNLSIAKINE